MKINLNCFRINKYSFLFCFVYMLGNCFSQNSTKSFGGKISATNLSTLRPIEYVEYSLVPGFYFTNKRHFFELGTQLYFPNNTIRKHRYGGEMIYKLKLNPMAKQLTVCAFILFGVRTSNFETTKTNFTYSNSNFTETTFSSTERTGNLRHLAFGLGFNYALNSKLLFSVQSGLDYFRIDDIMLIKTSNSTIKDNIHSNAHGFVFQTGVYYTIFNASNKKSSDEN